MSSKLILVVDDDHDFAASTAEILELKGHRVDIAHTGEDAVAMITARTYDLAFVDIMLPGMNGVDSLNVIRQTSPATRVIMMTGYSVQQLLDQAVEDGAWKVLHKPMDIKAVFAAIDQISPNGVLVVDDDKDFLDSVRDVLEAQHFNVFVAQDGQQALDRMQHHTIDVLILDLRLPILDGVDVYRKLRESGFEVPTIVVTAYGATESEAVERLQDMSVAGIFSKPVRPAELIQSISNLLAPPTD